MFLMSENKAKADSEGFSLIELIVVIAVMAVLMVVLVPQYTRFIEKTKLQEDNSAISEVVESMKLQAITANVVDQGTYTGYIAVCSLVRYPGENSFHIWMKPSETLADEFTEYFIEMHRGDNILLPIDDSMLRVCALNSYEVAEIVSGIELTSSTYKSLPWKEDHLGTFQEVSIISFYYND